MLPDKEVFRIKERDEILGDGSVRNKGPGFGDLKEVLQPPRFRESWVSLEVLGKLTNPDDLNQRTFRIGNTDFKIEPTKIKDEREMNKI